MFSSVACLVGAQFSTLSYKWQHFRKRIIESKVHVLTFSVTLSEIFLIPKGIQQDITINVLGLEVKYPIYLSDFNQT